MANLYIAFSTHHPLVAAFLQFLVLGTAGEVLSTMIRTRRRSFPFSLSKLLLKAFGWALLGGYIKFMFVTASAGVQGLVGYGVLPAAFAKPETTGVLILAAFATSVLMNVMLGPSMMLLHRLADNWIDRLLGHRGSGWKGMDQAMGTLLWLWVPLHTFTFSQPQEIRIGVAAVLSMVLGIVMGYFNRQEGPR